MGRRGLSRHLRGRWPEARRMARQGAWPAARARPAHRHRHRRQRGAAREPGRAHPAWAGALALTEENELVPMIPDPRMSRRAALRSMGAAVLLLGSRELAFGASIVAVRVWPAADYTRVTIESDSALSAKHFVAEN